MVREYICFIICTYDLTLQQSSPAIQGIRLYVLRKDSHLVTAVGLQIHGITCAMAYIVLSPVSLSASLALMVTLIANLMCLDIFLTDEEMLFLLAMLLCRFLTGHLEANGYYLIQSRSRPWSCVPDL